MDAIEILDDKDSGPEVQINIPSSVLNRIEELMGGTEQFDKADFDAVAYINRMFPTEQSLSGVEAATAKCQYRLAAVHEDIRQMVRRQPEQRCGGQKALLDAQETIKELAVQVTEINKKSERSAGTVREITAEIKQLDCAKTNLTAAITTLNHAHMLAGALCSLRGLASKRMYQDIVAPLQACMEVLQQLEVYKDLPELGSLRSQLMDLRASLAEQILADFKDAFTGGGKSSVSQRTLTEACGVVDVLEPAVREELLGWLVDRQLQEYVHLFSREQETAWLAHIERRYAWLKKHLLAFEDGPGLLLPASWAASQRVAHAFTEITRNELAALMTSRSAELDVKLLVYAIQKTRAFEMLLHKRFVGTDYEEDSEIPEEAEENKDKVGEKEFRWVGSIGRCFEPHLHLYISSLDAALQALLQTFIQDARTPPTEDESAGGAGGAVLASCAELFVFYKKCLVQCKALSPGHLPQLGVVFAKYLREYTRRVLAAQLPARAPLAAVLPRARLTRPTISLVCRLLSTAAYCAATTATLRDKLQRRAAVDTQPLLQEQEQLQAFTHECIGILVGDLTALCSPALASIRSVGGGNGGEHSAYVTQLQLTFNEYMPILHRNLAANRKYLTQFCIRFVDSFLPEFTQAAFRSRAVGMSGGAGREAALVLLVDLRAVKAALLQLPVSEDGGEKRQPPATYTKVVLRHCARCEAGLQWLAGEGGAGPGEGDAGARERDALLASLSPQDVALLRSIRAK